jgi:hypothetical protein
VQIVCENLLQILHDYLPAAINTAYLVVPFVNAEVLRMVLDGVAPDRTIVITSWPYIGCLISGCI